MKKMLSVLIVLAYITTYVQAQDKIIGEKRPAGVIGEKNIGDAEMTENNREIESAFADYIQQKTEMDKSLAELRMKIEEGIKLLEKNQRFKSAKQGIKLRYSWKEALKLQEEANKKIKVVKSSVVAPDMVQ